MTTKKKTVKPVQEELTQEIVPAEPSAVLQKEAEETTTAAADVVAQVDIAKPAQNHVSVVIPYCKEFAQGKELLLALRSWQKNVRFGVNIVVIGDREDWFSEEVTFIEHQRESDNPQMDAMEKLKLAISSPFVTERFIWSNDDIYVVNPVSLAHIELPKILGELNPDKYSGVYATNMLHTKQLLQQHGLPTLNYGTHTPFLFDKSLLMDMFEKFPVLQEGGYLFTSVYFNAQPYPAHPVLLDWPKDQVLLPIISKSPDEKKVVEMMSRKVFFNNAESGYSPWLEHFLEKQFPDASDFEE